MTLTKSRHWYNIKKLVPTSLYEPALNAYYQSRSLLYKGDNVYCPVCDKFFKEFIKGHSCPYCGSGRRHRLLYLYLKNNTNFFTDQLSVLHFAPEHCFYKRFEKQPNLYYKSADLGSPRAMERIDMTNIQYPDNIFDVVISSHVLEHIPDDALAMKELYRVAKPGSWSIHQAPIDYGRETTYEDPAINTNDDRLKHFGHIDHKRVYGRDYKDRLSAAGFIVHEEHYPSTFSGEKIKQYGLDTWEKIYLCRKQAGSQ